MILNMKKTDCSELNKDFEENLVVFRKKLFDYYSKIRELDTFSSQPRYNPYGKIIVIFDRLFPQIKEKMRKV